MADTLYEQDFVLWTKAQSKALREAAAGGNTALDWENLAEEIESLGRSERRELRSRIARIIEHLLKLEHSPAEAPRGGWKDTDRRERGEIELLLEDSSSLRQEGLGYHCEGNDQGRWAGRSQARISWRTRFRAGRRGQGKAIQ
ncbi:MAG: DUF29 domain-containing protein [Acetobacteraceae bacterium]|nr:DUF29 domain-containing protein [Acetobacteraceae bacterium]